MDKDLHTESLNSDIFFKSIMNHKPKTDVTLCEETKTTISKTKLLLKSSLPNQGTIIASIKHQKCPVIQLVREQIARRNGDSFEEELAQIREKQERERSAIGQLKKYRYPLLALPALLLLLWAALIIGAHMGIALCNPLHKGYICIHRCHAYFWEWSSYFTAISHTSHSQIRGVF